MLEPVCNHLICPVWSTNYTHMLLLLEMGSICWKVTLLSWSRQSPDLPLFPRIGTLLGVGEMELQRT